MKKVLNVNSLKSQQSMIDIRFLNVYVFSFNMCSLKILNSKKEIEKKNLIFVKVNVI